MAEERQHAGEVAPESMPDTLADAADLFQAQLNQLTQWKQQLSGQMDALRQDSVKVLERQKALAAEKQRLEQEGMGLLAERGRLAKMQEELQQESQRLGARAQEFEQTQSQRQSAIEAARQELSALEARLSAQEKGLAEREAACQAEAARLKAALEAAESERRGLAEATQRAAQERENLAGQGRQLEEARQGLARQHHEAQKRLEQMDAEHAEQLEALAKQTKRLSERRAEIEATGTDVEKTVHDRVGKVTEGLRAELAQAQEKHGKQVGQLQQQLQQYEQAAAGWKTRETQVHDELASAEQQVRGFKDKLKAAGAELAQARRQVSELEARLAQAPAANGNAGDSDKARALAEQIVTLEKQRDDLAAQVFALQDAAGKQEQAAQQAQQAAQQTQQAQSELEGQVGELRKKNAALEGQIARWKAAAKEGGGKGDGAAPAAAAFHRERLVRQAKSIRSFRQEARELKASLEAARVETAQGREQLRARKENLEQVKRLLEKQEMVMARKLADHNAIKTVAAVGIFVIMILGGSFLAVYRFVNPVYRSEAMVEAAPPADMPAAQVAAWLRSQADFVRSGEVAQAAWKILRSPEEHYVMHDVRDEWTGSFAQHLVTAVDPASKTIAIRYTGLSGEGVAQVCNALATAYTMPGMRDGTGATKDFGNGAKIMSRATASQYPAQDNRMMLSLSTVAMVLFVSLLLIIVFRHFVARQLKEIDEMADEKELADIQAELPADVKPA